MPNTQTQLISPESARYSARVSGAPPSALAQALYRPFLAAFLVCLGLALIGVGPSATFGLQTLWFDGAFYSLAVALTLVSMARRLPVQNVAACALIAASAAGLVTAVGARTGMPFGRFEYTFTFAPALLGIQAGVIPLVWTALLLNSRGVAKLMLRPWRREEHYGYWLLGASSGLAVLAGAGHEAFAVQFRHYWIWRGSTPTTDWYGTPWMDFATWLAIAALGLAMATPWLISKRPVQQPQDFSPLWVWLGLNGYFTVGNLLSGCWWAVALTAVVSAAAALLAYRGSREEARPSQNGSSPK